MLFSALANLIIYVSSVAVLWAENKWENYVNRMIANWTIGFVALIFLFLVLALTILHLYLIRNGLTTFEYILSKKTLEERKLYDLKIHPKN